MNWSTALVIFGFIFLSSCDQEDPPLPQSLSCDNTAILDVNEYENGSDDAFDIDTIWISNNCLSITYRFGGGCGDTEMKLVGYHESTTPVPPSVQTRFSFKDDDNCEAYLKSTESFDLTPYQKKDNPQVILKIAGWNKTLLYNY